MRLICPNCDAQYDVPDDVMPPEGRDVQCSNCGQTWFQRHPDAVTDDAGSAEADLIEDEEVIRATEEEDLDPPAPDPVSDPTPDPEPMPEPEPEPEPEEDTQADPNLEEFVPPTPRRRSLDPEVAAVLQEEAELETQARQSEAIGSVETQPDLGLNDTEGSDEARKRAREARDRMARMRGEDPASFADEATVTAAAAGSRRTLLPDIEEINSTLRSNSDRSPNDDPGQTAQVEARERKRFGRGFILMVVLAAILALLYVYAPQLAEAVPQADPWISAYVGMVDQWRMWLDTQVEGLLSWLDAAAVSSGQ